MPGSPARKVDCADRGRGRLPFSPFITTHILDPTHLSISSVRHSERQPSSFIEIHPSACIDVTNAQDTDQEAGFATPWKKVSRTQLAHCFDRSFEELIRRFLGLKARILRRQSILSAWAKRYRDRAGSRWVKAST